MVGRKPPVPQHDGIAIWNLLANPDRAQGLRIFQTVTNIPAPGHKPKDFVELYLGGKWEALLLDVASRPDHYTDRQKEILGRVEAGKPHEATEHELNELVLSLTSSTRQGVAAVTKATDKRHEDPLDELLSADGEPSFENQDFGPLITIA